MRQRSTCVLAPALKFIAGLLCGLLTSMLAHAQVSVTTARNDIGRTGQNLSETVLTPSNVNSTQFGKLFAQAVDGELYAQPLYLSGLTVNGAVHNVVFVATEHDSVYAFDADNTSGANSSPLWQASMLTAAHGASAGASTEFWNPNSDINPEVGITGTPVIDPGSGTLYVVSKTMESLTVVERLHALDVTSGAEKFGGPVVLSGGVPGAGTGSAGGTVPFFLPGYGENQRPGLLLLNGVVYIGFASHEDISPWHGWVLAYNATTLRQTGAFCSTPNDNGGGIWMSGTGLAADQLDPAGHPYGRMFAPTGNGGYNATVPYNSTMNYGDSILNLDLSGGAPTVVDAFTPSNQAYFAAQDIDVASGGLMVLPTQTTGPHPNLLVQAGKSGMLYLLNRENLGGYNATDQVVQSTDGAVPPLWSSPAYWNGRVYFAGQTDHLKSFPLVNGQLALTAVTMSQETYEWPGATASISANGNGQGIAWSIDSGAYTINGAAILRAHDASNVASTLYSSTTNAARDGAGPAVKFTVPTIANGKVYVGTANQLDVYGLLSGATQTAMPSFNPGSGSFSGSLGVSIADVTPNSTIYYTTDGSPATTSSNLYGGTITVTSAKTINAIATSPGLLVSAQASATYTPIPTAATPTFSPAAGTYSTTQSVTLSDTSAGATIYYTTDGSTPTTGSAVYSAPIVVSATRTIKALASASGYTASAVASATYTISAAPVTATPSFSPAAGSYGTTQNVTLSDTTVGATIHYTTDGSTPTTSSTVYSAPIVVSATQTIKALASASGYTTSAVSSATYTIGSGTSPSVSYPSGFTAAGLSFNGGATVSGGALVVTDGGLQEGRSAWYSTPVNVQKFTTDFTFQLSAAAADGYTFTIQNVGLTAVGGAGGQLGYGGIGSSVAVKFDLYNNAGEGTDSTGFYTNGAAPTVPAQDMTASGVNLISGDTLSAHLVYDGTTLTLTITDLVTSASFSTSTAINIPATVGGNTAYVGFTGGTGGYSATQKILSWTYTSSASSGTPAAATPTFGPAAGSYSTTQSVTLSDSTVGATIHYTTDGSTPTTGSAVYSAPIVVSATQTIKALASASGYTASAVASATYTISAAPVTATPSFSPAAGSYSTTQSVTLSDTTVGATIHYTTDGSTPTTSSTVYSAPIVVSATQTIKALASASGYTTSAVSSATYTIGSGTSPSVSYPSGFTAAGLSFNGGATVSGGALVVTDGGLQEGRSAWYSTPVNVQKFTTDFTFQLSAAAADGYTFTIQNVGLTAVGGAGGQLGYGGIGSSVAVKFDLYNNAGEGTDSTGFYTNGAAPTVPAQDMTASGVNLISGDTLSAHLVYDGTTLTLTITDLVTSASFSTSTAINIPATVGGNTAYVGFTGGTGGYSATQKILSWTYTSSASSGTPAAATPTFSPAAGSYSTTQSVTLSDTTVGATIHYTTDGSTPTTSSTVYSAPIVVSATQTIKALASASGYTTSAVSSATYTIGSGTSPSVSYPSGFTAAGLSFNGGATVSGGALVVTDGGLQEGRSAWYSTPVNVQKFTTDFTFQLSAAAADGYTFTIQNVGLTAVGGAGGQLGYGGIGSSVAVKFDLYNNAGEGTDSTGFYTNGAAPTVPAQDMTASGVNLISGDTLSAHLVYDGTTLTLTITDLVTSASFSTSTAINIPATVGGNTAYVGFTGGTGGYSATQKILSWTYAVN